MIDIGQYNELQVLRSTSVGLYLGDDEGEDVLLPKKYVSPTFAIGDTLKVFVYKDGQHRKVATTLQPKILLHQFAYLRVTHVNAYGAFLDWGMEKELFVAFREQPKRMEAGRSYVVCMYHDEESDRLAASGDVAYFLDTKTVSVKEDDEVDVLIWESTELGYNVIINHRHKGLIYFNELYNKVQIGDLRKGYVKQVRPDNKIDILLHKTGHEQIEPNAQFVLQKLKEAGGFLPLTDNSSPDLIIHHLEMSKKNFKKAIGSLYKQRLIRLAEEGIYSVS